MSGEKLEKKNILLCVAGMTPQIITETLYALTQQNGETIDEIRVITTLEERNKVLESLLDEESGMFFAFCLDYGIDPKSIKFDETTIALLDTPDGKTLDDIRTPEENTLAGDKICKIVAELCKDERVRIHASAAGGRKTMSIYLTAAMSLFGRSDDALSHILVNEDFEGHPKFFYPPPTHQTLEITHRITKEVLREVSTKDARIYLAEIPFIRLRGIGAKAFDEKTQTYKQAVDKAQNDLRLAESAGAMRFDLKRNLIKVADRQVKLSLREMFVYALFAHFRQANLGENGFVNLKQIKREHLETICRMISQAKGDDLGFEDFASLAKGDFVHALNVESLRARVGQETGESFSVAEAREKVVKSLREILGKIEPKLKKVFAPEELFAEFYIERRGEKEAYTFGFRIEPERIKFEIEEN